MKYAYSQLEGIVTTDRDEILVCLKCSKEVIFIKEHTIQEGIIVRSHFMHKNDSNCEGEASMHTLAQHIIKKYGSKLNFIFKCNCDKEIKFNITGEYVLERRSLNKQFRFDVAIMNNNNIIGIVEIHHTNPVTYEKAKYMTLNNYIWCEVNATKIVDMFRDKESLSLDIIVEKCHYTKCHECHEKSFYNCKEVLIKNNDLICSKNIEDDCIDNSRAGGGAAGGDAIVVTNGDAMTNVSSTITNVDNDLIVNIGGKTKVVPIIISNNYILNFGSRKGKTVESIFENKDDYIYYLACISKNGKTRLSDSIVKDVPKEIQYNR